MMTCSFATVALMRPLTCAVLLLAAGSAQALPASSPFNHGDWEIVCDNTGTCRAAGYGAEDGTNGFSLLLERAAGPHTAVKARLRFGGFDEADVPHGPLRLFIGRRDLGVLDDATDDVIVPAAHQLAAVLRALPGRTAMFIRDSDGRRWPVPSNGASAVLLRMDDMQGRLDTPGALVRKGTRSEDQVPAAVLAPTISPSPALAATRTADAALLDDERLRAALLATLSADEECRGLSADEQDLPPMEIERLDGDHLLVSATCWRGAYNTGTGYWVIRGTAPWQPVQVTLDASEFQRDTATISAVQKGRGLGDCYWSARWRWDGMRFQHVHEQTTGMCRGYVGGAWELPTWVTAGSSTGNP